jgi:hypothetical protein
MDVFDKISSHLTSSQLLIAILRRETLTFISNGVNLVWIDDLNPNNYNSERPRKSSEFLVRLFPLRVLIRFQGRRRRVWRGWRGRGIIVSHIAIESGRSIQE